MAWETWRPEGYKSTSTKWEDWQATKPFGEAFDIKEASPTPNAFNQNIDSTTSTTPKLQAPKLSLLDNLGNTAKNVGSGLLNAGGKAFDFLDKNISAPLATGYNDFMLNMYKASGGDNENLLKNLEDQSRTTREKYQSDDNSYLKNLGTGLLENAGAMFGGPQGGYAGLGQTLGNAVAPTLKGVGVGGKLLEKAEEVTRLLPMFESAKGGAIRNAEAQGLSEEDTKKYALINGLAEMGTEMMYMPDWFKKSVGMDLGDSLPTTLKDSIKDYLQDAVAEGGEEVISGFIQNKADKKYLNIEKSKSEQLADMRDNFVGGAVFSGVLGLPNIGSYKANAQYLDSLNNSEDILNTGLETENNFNQEIPKETNNLNKEENNKSTNNDLLTLYNLIDSTRNPRNDFMLEAPKVNNINNSNDTNNNLVSQPQLTQDFKTDDTPKANVTGLGEVKVVDVDTTSSNLPAVIIEMPTGEQFPIRNAIAQNSMTIIDQPSFAVDGENININNNLALAAGQAMAEVGQVTPGIENNQSILNQTQNNLFASPKNIINAENTKNTKNTNNEIVPRILNQPQTTLNNKNTTSNNSDVQASNRVYSVDVNNINVDPETFQFKSNTDSQGVTTQFKNGEKYDPYKAGVLTLYRDTDNKLFVVNGHHRLEFAKRSGVNRVDAQILNSKDGWSKADARTLGAKINMAEGKGTATDSAKIFRENKLSIDDIKKDGISLADSKIRTGYELSKLSDPLFRAVTTGKLSENKGAIIGRELEGSITKQQEVFKLVKEYEKKGKNITDGVLNEIIQMAKASDTYKEQQATLFGLEEFEKSNMIQRGEIITGLKARLSKEKKLFATLTNKNKADIIKAVGNKLADKNNAQNLSEAELTTGILDTFKNAKGHSISDAISIATDKYSKGEMTKAEAINQALNSIKNIIKSGEINGKNNERNTNRSTKMLDNGTGTQVKTEYKQTSTQRDNIGKAKVELQAVATRFKISNKRGTNYYLNQGYKGLGIGADFIENHNLNLIGKEVKNYRDLAEVAQIYRDPRWETFRIVFVKDGVVVGETGITSHIPNESKVFRKDYDSEINHLKKYMKNIKSNGYYLLHNHPSGYPEGSNADIKVTKMFERSLGPSEGHVILNSNKFGLIKMTNLGEMGNNVYPLTYKEAGEEFEEKILTPSIPNNLLGVKINGTNKFAEIYKSMEVTGNKITVIYTNAKSEIRGIQEIHINNLNNYQNIIGYLGNQMRNIGATDNFIVAPSDLSIEHKSTLTRMGDNNITTDIINIDNETWRSKGKFTPRRNMPDAIARQKAKNVAKRINGIKEKKTEYIGDNFYSKLENIIDDRLGKKINSAELDKNINAWVRKGEIKAEEIKWSGIKEWLKDQDNKTLSKDEVMKQLKASRLIISKITTNDKQGNENDTQTKYNKYITNGGENYQEILFQIDKSNLEGQKDFISPHFNEENIIAHVRTTDRKTASTKAIPKREKVLYLEELQSDLHQEGRGTGYSDVRDFRKVNSEIQKRKNKINDETILIADKEDYTFYGRKVNSFYDLLDYTEKNNFKKTMTLFLEKDGFKEQRQLIDVFSPDNQDDIYNNLEKFKDIYNNLDGQLYVAKSYMKNPNMVDERVENKGFKVELAKKSEIRDFMELKDQKESFGKDEFEDNLIPDVPFSKTWDEFLIKNMIQKATEEGYERIAWTSGREQADRYNLSKVIDTVIYKSASSDNSSYSVTGFKSGSAIFHKYFGSEKEMSAFFGKEVTSEILSNKGEPTPNGSMSLSTNDLSVGGNGMKMFYDKMLVDNVNKYVKKWRTKVETAHIDGIGERNSIKITDDMKKDVTENGQAIFERKSKYNINNDTDIGYSRKGIDEVVLSKGNTNLNYQVAKYGKNYREILFKGKGLGVNYSFRKNDADTRNVMSFARTTDRNTLDGKKILYLEEVASTEFQHSLKYQPINQKELDKANRGLEHFSNKENKTSEDIQLKDAFEKRIKALDKTEYTKQDNIYSKNWVDYTMSKVIDRAIQEGYDGIAWTTSDERANVLNLPTGDGLKDFYGKNMKSIVENIVSDYEIKVNKNNIEKLGTRDGIIFSDEMKNKVNNVGEYTSNYNSEKERKHYDTYMKSDAIDPEVKKIIENTDKHYRQLGNHKVWNIAKDLVETRYNYARELVSNKKTLENAYDVAISEAILLKLQKEGNWQEASEWASKISEKLTQAGQVVQAASLIGRMTPEGILRTANTMLKRTSTKKQREISDKIINNINDQFKGLNDEALEDVIKKALLYAKNKGINIDNMSVPVPKGSSDKKSDTKNTDSNTEQTGFDFADADLDKEENLIKKALNKKGGPGGQASDETSEKLASKVSSHIPKKKFKKNEPLDDMVNVLYGVARQVLPAKNKSVPRDPMELINQAMVNREEYAICWNMAKEIVSNKWAGNEEALNLLNTYFAQYLDKPFSDNLMNKAINNAMDTLDISLDELVRKHYSEVDFAKDSIKEKFIYSGLSETEAEELADFIENEFKKMTEKKKNQILEKALKSKPKTKKQKELWEKVVEFSNLGAFEKDDFKNLVANKLGMGTMTPELAKELVERANRLQTLEDGEEKNVEIQLMMDRIYAQVPPTKWQKISTIQAIAQLLNPLTYTRNLIGNKGFGTVDRYLTYIPAKMIDKLVSIKTKENTVFAPHPLEYRKGYKEGMRIATRDAKLGINTRKLNGKFDTKPTTTFRPENMNNIEKFFMLDKLEKKLNKSLTGTDTAFKEAIIRESLYSQMKNAKVTEPTPKMIEIANQLADYRTFNNDTVLSSFFSNLKASLNSPVYTHNRGAKGKKYEWGLGDMLIKYPKTPANIISVSIDYSPIGLVSSIYKLWYSSKSTEVEFNQQAFSQGIGRGIVGSTIIAVGAVLAKLGIITGGGDDDKDLQALKNETGFGQYRINLSALDRLVSTGFDARYSKPQKDDLILNYDWFQPLAIPIAIGANIENEKDDNMGIVGSIVSAFNAGVDTIVEQPLVSGIKRFTQTRQITEAVTNMVQDIPSSFIPTFVNQIKKLLDNQSRITYDNDWIDEMENKVKVKLPFLNQTLEPNISTLGKEKETYQNGSNNPFNVFFNPAFSSRYNVDETYQKALTIYEKTGAKEHIPIKLKQTVSYEGQEYKLTPTEYTYYQKKVGKAIVNIYKDIDTSLNKADLLEEVKKISNAMSDAKSEARDEIIKKRGIQSIKAPTLNKKGILSKY